jgi:hypothetical protein
VEISHNLLVAMMFVMLLSIGVGNILMSLAGALDRASGVRVHWIPLTWVVLLLLTSFELFWQTLAIVNIEDWKFGQFLYVISGPVALLFAISLMLPDSVRAGEGDYLEHYFSVSRRFFSLLALLMVWMVGIDFLFGEGFGAVTAVNTGEGVVFAVLAVSRAERVHETVTGLACAIFLLDVALQGFGAIG